jgi:hypothetical protein
VSAIFDLDIIGSTTSGTQRGHKPKPTPYLPPEAITRRELEAGLKSTDHQEIAPYHQP